jgi:hypothetical protein
MVDTHTQCVVRLNLPLVGFLRSSNAFSGRGNITALLCSLYQLLSLKPNPLLNLLSLGLKRKIRCSTSSTMDNPNLRNTCYVHNRSQKASNNLIVFNYLENRAFANCQQERPT